jgi:hypothetical protein
MLFLFTVGTVVVAGLSEAKKAWDDEAKELEETADLRDRIFHRGGWDEVENPDCTFLGLQPLTLYKLRHGFMTLYEVQKHGKPEGAEEITLLLTADEILILQQHGFDSEAGLFVLGSAYKMDAERREHAA